MNPALRFLSAFLLAVPPLHAGIGIGEKPIEGSELVFDGTREMLDAKWTYWRGPAFASSLPIKWKIVEDPVAKGTVLMTDDPVAAGGKYGSADIVTKKAYRDFRLHIEFLVNKPGGNSGVYLQNRFEIQICDGDKGLTNSPGGLKLQCEGHGVRYRNIWIKELFLTRPDTGFTE